MLQLVDRVYPEFHLHTQATGRWSTVRPPLAQLPSDLRDIIKPDLGTVWIGHDWDQIELRLQAGLANDRPLLEAFENAWDIHTLNCCDIFGYQYPPQRNDPHGSAECAAWRSTLGWRGKEDDRRVFSKRYVYRLIYRGNPKFAGDIPGARTLGLDGPKLVKASQNWLLPHHAIVAYWARVDQQVKDHGYTQTWAGRKRRYMSIGPTRAIPNSVFREAANFPMQGGVADIMNLAVIEICERLPFVNLVYTMHDSMWMECPVEREDEAWPVYQEVVQQARNINGVLVPFPGSFKRIREDGVEEKVKECQKIR